VIPTMLNGRVSGAVIPAFDLSRKLASEVYGIQQEKAT
jgi:zona occludens toxin (predicted ATPase)